jgi:hypothetical protein
MLIPEIFSGVNSRDLLIWRKDFGDRKNVELSDERKLRRKR